MNTQISIPIQTDQFLGLVDFLRTNGDPRDPVEVVATAIEYWLDNASWKPELLSVVSAASRGYRWKRFFLPHGTEIRMQYKGKYYYARVEGDEILYDGKSISPGGLANAIAGGSRNAWRDLWIKRSEDKEWKLADECRRETEEVAERLLQELRELPNAPASSTSQGDQT
jgi:hypothetical protein